MNEAADLMSSNQTPGSTHSLADTHRKWAGGAQNIENNKMFTIYTHTRTHAHTRAHTRTLEMFSGKHTDDQLRVTDSLRGHAASIITVMIMMMAQSCDLFTPPLPGAVKFFIVPAGESESHSNSRMLGMVLLWFCSFGLLHLSSPLVHGNVPLDEGPGTGRHVESSYLSEGERSHAPNPLHEPALLPVDSVEDAFLIDAGSYDEDAAAGQLQGRAMRSPRRCIPHQQSCLGYPLPCCDPCDTCYCRFFNAICYCRRVGHACPSRRT